MLLVVVAGTAILAGRAPVATSSGAPPSASIAPSPSPQGTVRSPVIETAAVVARIPIGSAGQPHVQGAGLGGAGWTGPRSFAVEASGRIWVWDSLARSLYVYDAEGGPQTVFATDLPESASDLLAAAGKLYLRTDSVVYVVDPTTGKTSATLTGAAATTAYPRTRARLIALGKDQVQALGTDANGSTYERTSCFDCFEYRRVAGGAAVTLVRTDSGPVVDFYLDDRGGVYELLWERLDNRPVALVVRRALTPPS
jgi:hypothetical protein